MWTCSHIGSATPSSAPVPEAPLPLLHGSFPHIFSLLSLRIAIAVVHCPLPFYLHYPRGAATIAEGLSLG